MKASFGLLGTLPSSLNMLCCGLHSRMVSRTAFAVGLPMPVIDSNLFFRFSSKYICSGSAVLSPSTTALDTSSAKIIAKEIVDAGRQGGNRDGFNQRHWARHR